MNDMTRDDHTRFMQQLLACPTCLHDLQTCRDARADEVLFCATCGAIYPVHAGVPYLIDIRALLRLPEDLLAAWHITQRRAEALYHELDPASCSLSTREDVQQFRQFMDLRDKVVLDIGSSAPLLPGYVEGSHFEYFIGLDPIPSPSPPAFPFLVGTGERLAFRDNAFDVVILATSLDHVMNVESTLSEVCRVLKPEGKVYFWGGFVATALPLAQTLSRRLFQRLSDRKPVEFEAAITAYLHNQQTYATTLQHIDAHSHDYAALLVDQYHFRHFTEESLLEAFAKADLWPADTLRVKTSAGVESSRCICFERASPSYLIYRHTTALHRDVQTLQQQAEALQQQLASLQQQTGLIEHQGGDLQQHLGALQQQTEALQHQGGDIQQHLGALQHRTEALQHQGGDIQQHLGALQHRTEALQRQGQTTHQFLHDMSARTRAIQQQERGVQQRLEMLQQQVHITQQQGETIRRLMHDDIGLDRIQAAIEAALVLRTLLAPLRRLKRRYRRFRHSVLAPLRWLNQTFHIKRRVRPICQVLFVAAACIGALLSGPKQPRGDRRRVLMLTTSLIDIDPRINKVAHTLADHGYEVDIMCYQHEDTTTVREDLIRPGVCYVRVPLNPAWPNGRFGFFYQEPFRQFGLQRAYDYVHANDLTTLLAGWILARRKGVPLIYDAHEMWSENVIYDGLGWIPMPRHIRTLARYYEGFLVKYVDLFLTVSRSIQNEFQRRYHLAQKPHLLANYPELSLAQVDPSTLPSIRELCGLSADHFITLYQGGVSELRNIENVIKAHGDLPLPCVFVIRGPGVDYFRSAYEALAKELGLEQRIFYLPPVAMSEVMASAVDADCGIVMLRNICKNFYWFYPNKFFEYMMSSLPVAVSHFPDVTAHVEKEKCGVVFDPESPQSIAEALRWLYEHPEEARAMGRRGREGVRREYHWEAATEGLLQEYAKL